MATIQTSIVMADNISNVLHNITGALNLTISAFQDIQDTASRDFNADTFSTIREQINAATIATQAFEQELEGIKPRSVPVEVTPVWNIDSNIDIFQNTGVDRLNQEMSSLNDIAGEVLSSQQRIGQQALNMELLPPNASWDINATNQRIEELVQKIADIQQIDLSKMDDASISRMNSEYEAMRSSLNSVINLQSEMNTAIEQGDFTGLNSGYSQLNSIAEQAERRVRENMAAIEEMNNIQWNPVVKFEIVDGNGTERLQQELNLLQGAMSEVTARQSEISNQAASMNILPSNAIEDINNTSNYISSLVEKLQSYQNIDINLLSDADASALNSDIENTRALLESVLSVQNNIGEAINNTDVVGLNNGFNQLNDIAERLHQNVRASSAAIEEMNNIQWQSPQNIDVFQNSGVERFESEISSAMSMMDELSNAQNALTTQAASMTLLPPQAINDISGLGSRITDLQTRLQELSSVQLNDMGAQQVNSTIESLRQAFSQMSQIQEQFRNSMGDFDVSGANNAFNQLNSLVDNTERNFRDSLNRINEMDLSNAAWTTPQTIDVIVGGGISRYKQEIGSANDMMNRLTAAQYNISQNASSMRILPPQAVNDIASMDSRIQALRNQIEQVQRSRIGIVGVERANAEVESLRERLNQALQTQEDLNAALNNMDVSAANQAYNQLNSIINSTEQNVRDNINEQQNFNSELKNGSSAADGLQNKIMGVAAAYLSIQSAGKVLDLSDTMTQTNARLNLIVDDGGSVQELQNKIYESAQRARSDFQMTSDVVSKLGMQAADAFSSNDELIAFAEQLNKTFKIAGTDAQGVESVMYNLTQALSSGVLRGQDLNSVFSNAQPIVQNIADYMGVTVGEIRDMAADGQLSADVVKNAMLSAAQETNATFETIPLTFADIASNIRNQALMMFQPLLERLNEIANSPAFQVFVDNVINVISVVANVAMDIFSMIISIAQYVSNNWATIGPLVIGIAGAIGLWAIAQALLNIAMNANPVVLFGGALIVLVTILPQLRDWILLVAVAFGLFNIVLNANPIFLIVTLIALIIIKIVEWVRAVGGLKIAWLIVVNALLTAWDWVKIGFFTGVYWVIDLWDKMKLGMMTAGTAIANFMGDMKADVLMILQNMVNGAISIINDFIATLNNLPCVEIQAVEMVTFGAMADLENEAAKQSRATALDDYRSEIESGIQGRDADLDAMKADARAATSDRLAEIGQLKATAANQTEDSTIESATEPPLDIPPYGGLGGVGSDIGGAGGSGGIASGVNDIANNTAKTATFSEEDLKYLRDIAERDVINKFTVAEINFDMGGITNNVNSEVDLDGIVDYIGDGMMEKLEIVAEGVYA